MRTDVRRRARASRAVPRRHTVDDLRVPVLIAGGSLVGLTTSLLLAAQGVPHLLVERHRGTAAPARRLLPPADDGGVPRRRPAEAGGGGSVAGIRAERGHRLGAQPGRSRDDVLLTAL